MKKQKLFATLLSIAASNPNGCTVNARTLEPITSGYAVAVKETQNSFGSEGLMRVINYARQNKSVNAFGGWYDSESGRYYFDATIIIEDKETAVKIGKLNKQLAIFDLNNMEEIRL